MDDRVKNKGGRPPSKPKPIVVVDKVETAEQPTITQDDIDYNGHVIHIEPHGRVIVSKLGLHVTEFANIDGDLEITDTGMEALINQARGYIDASIR